VSSALSPIELWLDRWELEPDGDAIERNGSHVAFVRRGDTRAVLKVLKPNSDEMLGPVMLAHYRGRSAVRVLGHEQNAVLLERALPGTELTETVLDGRDDEAVRILCGVMTDLHRDDPPPGPWPTVEDWGRAFARYRAGEPHPEIPPVLLDRAEAEFTDLCASQGRRFPLHGDLHHENIMFGPRGWLIIDPAGLIGDAALDVANMFSNPLDRFDLTRNEARIASMAGVFAETLGRNVRTILRYAFAYGCLSAAWHDEDGNAKDRDDELAVAAAVRDVLRQA